MKVVITGAAGQLGTDLTRAFADGHVTALSSGDLDITDADAVTDAISATAPDVVVNAAAYTNVDAAETDTDAAWAVNAAGPWHLARACHTNNVALVHVSTDYVFDGTADRPYTEFDTPNPTSAYGRTKHAGEQLVRETLDRHWIIRTAWIQGRHGNNFVKTMLRLGRERDALSVVNDQTGSPTLAADLATAIHTIVTHDVPYGTYHRTNTGQCTWHDLAATVFHHAGIDVDLTPITTAQYNAPAPRPHNSVLDNRKTTLYGLPPLRHWNEAITELLDQLEADENGQNGP